ncbi:MAG: DUF4393 domain-containing protein [Actinomycetota bacterium]|nr:DUF4393 domain-containing protein [Actinomycetota bacterium]
MTDDDPGASPPWPLSNAAALLSLAGQAARQVPGVGLTERELHRAENAVLRQLRDRLHSVDDSSGQPLAAPAPEAAPEEASDPAMLLAGLLQDSVEQTGPSARTRLHRWLLQQLLPDQARILAALSDGSSYPLVHVVRKGPLSGPLGAGGETVLENASTVGRAAGVALPDLVPVYLGHLRVLGLVDVGPEEESLREGYDIAETDGPVRSAVERTGSNAVRTTRRSVRLSELGRDLWSACQAETTGEL